MSPTRRLSPSTTKKAGTRAAARDERLSTSSASKARARRCRQRAPVSGEILQVDRPVRNARARSHAGPASCRHRSIRAARRARSAEALELLHDARAVGLVSALHTTARSRPISRITPVTLCERKPRASSAIRPAQRHHRRGLHSTRATSASIPPPSSRARAPRRLRVTAASPRVERCAPPARHVIAHRISRPF